MILNIHSSHLLCNYYFSYLIFPCFSYSFFILFVFLFRILRILFMTVLPGMGYGNGAEGAFDGWERTDGHMAAIGLAVPMLQLIFRFVLCRVELSYFELNLSS